MVLCLTMPPIRHYHPTTLVWSPDWTWPMPQGNHRSLWKLVTLWTLTFLWMTWMQGRCWLLSLNFSKNSDWWMFQWMTGILLGPHERCYLLIVHSIISSSFDWWTLLIVIVGFYVQITLNTTMFDAWNFKTVCESHMHNTLHCVESLLM